MNNEFGGFTITEPLTYAYDNARKILEDAAIMLAKYPEREVGYEREVTARIIVNTIFNAVMMQIFEQRQHQRSWYRRLFDRIVGEA